MKRWFKRFSRARERRLTFYLIVWFIITLMIPNVALCYTESYSAWSCVSLIFLPLGIYSLLAVSLRRSGVVVLLCLPLLVISALQIVLLYLFGNSVVAADMFTNILTTNTSESTELLGNLYPAIIIVLLLFVPVMSSAVRELIFRKTIRNFPRHIFRTYGFFSLLIGLVALIPAHQVSYTGYVLRYDIFPFNVFYNMRVCLDEYSKMKNFERTSQDFSFDAVRADSTAQREIYVMVIGESSRAGNWQLFGYDRPTNPQLSTLEGVVPFTNMLTQSNATHKSVPMMLSSVATNKHAELYNQKGIATLFNEAGFETWFISTQKQQGGMIDKLAAEADHTLYLGTHNLDIVLAENVGKVIEESQSQKILVILHSLGSHFNYTKRYTPEFSIFTPDDDVSIRVCNHDMLVNSYDNTIVYTDHFLNETIKYLRQADICSALIYCSDHGEDILDDRRHRFLHASPTTTANQLFIPSFAWFSPNYRNTWWQKFEQCRTNADTPVNTHVIFHTLADIASIESDYIDRDYALTSDEFDNTKKRYYLSDHNKAIPYKASGLEEYDYRAFEKFGIFHL